MKKAKKKYWKRKVVQFTMVLKKRIIVRRSIGLILSNSIQTLIAPFFKENLVLVPITSTLRRLGSSCLSRDNDLVDAQHRPGSLTGQTDRRHLRSHKI
jgi:hypothetical protein